VLDERIEILVAVEQSQSLLDAAGHDQCVDGFSNRDAARPQNAEVISHLRCPSSWVIDARRGKGVFRSAAISCLGRALAGDLVKIPEYAYTIE
jgi:hypothetical protein